MNNILYFRRILQLNIMKKKESNNEAQLGCVMFGFNQTLVFVYSAVRVFDVRFLQLFLYSGRDSFCMRFEAHLRTEMLASCNSFYQSDASWSMASASRRISAFCFEHFSFSPLSFASYSLKKGYNMVSYTITIVYQKLLKEQRQRC